jgi:hypothetical protein
MTGNVARGNIILQTTEPISFIVWQDDKGRTRISRSDRPLDPLNDIVVMPRHPVLIEMSGGWHGVNNCDPAGKANDGYPLVFGGSHRCKVKPSTSWPKP